MSYLGRLVRATGAFFRGFAGKDRKQLAATDTGPSVGGFRVVLFPQVVSVRKPSLLGKLVTGDEGGKTLEIRWPEACAGCGSPSEGFDGRLIYTDSTLVGTGNRIEKTTLAVKLCETCFVKWGPMATLGCVVDVMKSDIVRFVASEGMMYFTFTDGTFAREFYRLNKSFAAWKCTKCGHYVPEDAQHCPGCGLAQPNRSGEATALTADAPA